MNTEEVQSISGGHILFIGDESKYEPYSERSFDEIKMYCKEQTKFTIMLFKKKEKKLIFYIQFGGNEKKQSNVALDEGVLRDQSQT